VISIGANWLGERGDDAPRGVSPPHHLSGFGPNGTRWPGEIKGAVAGHNSTAICLADGSFCMLGEGGAMAPWGRTVRI
jgi:hypothetical protein